MRNRHGRGAVHTPFREGLGCRQGASARVRPQASAPTGRSLSPYYTPSINHPHTCPFPPPTMPKRTGFTAWYDRLISSFSIEDLFVRKRPPGPSRTIYINEPLPDSYYNKKHKVLKEHQYNPNQVITSKYTLVTFLPRNLLEQYRRVANV